MNKKQKIAKRKQKKSRLRLKAKQADLLKNKKVDSKKVSQLLLKMAANGPERYFGIFRHSGKGFSQSVSHINEEPPRIPEHDIADATFLSMGIPAGLFHRERPEVGIHLNIAIGLMMSRNLCEITGLTLTGYLASRFLQLESGNNSDALNQTKIILRDAEIFCQKIETRFRKLPDKKLQQAKLSLNEKASICLELEISIFACKNDDDLSKVKDNIDDSIWTNMQSSNNLEMDKAMDDRFQSLKNITTISQFQTLIQKNESEARNRVVGLEIKANLESPDSDKGLRMQVQLNQLKANFGRISDDKDNSKFARDFELEFLCFGPLDGTIREEMERRVEKAVNKLI